MQTRRKQAHCQIARKTTAHQFTIDGECAQGKLIMENEATIENAYNAVTLWKPQDWDARGGIVIADDAVFKNNWRSVEFLKYQNFHPVTGEPMSYNSYFTNCEFVVDNDYLATGGFNAHVTMWGVNGVKINGCTFENKLGSIPSDRAIYTVDAGFVIKGACEVNDISPCPTGQYNKTTFDGFYRAIESSNSSNTLYQIYIRESGFSNNGYGIHFSSVNDAVVVGNTFKLGVFDDCNYDAGVGIYLDNCKRFAIEKNEFTQGQAFPAVTYVGIHTVNTNNAFDEIYKNDFDDMIVANYAEGKNWYEDWRKGLAYYCNTNQRNSWDFYVKKVDDIFAHGIQLLQGSRYYVAGNTFSPAATGHFDNRGSYEIDYYYDQASPAEVPSKLYRVEPYPELLANTCPNHYGGGDILLSTVAYQQREADYDAALSAYNTALSQYNNTSDSATRRMYEEQMSHYNMLLSRAAYDIVRSDLADTVAHPGLFETWQDKLNTYAAAESVIDLYLQQGDYTTAMNKVDSLQINFVFDSYDSVEYPYYLNLKTLQAGWLGQGRTIFDLTSSEISSLSAIADSSRGIAGAQARGILAFAYDSIYSYVNCAQMPDTSQKSASLNNEGDIEKSNYSFKALPNPARNFISFEYALPEDFSTGKIELFNTSGNLIREFRITDKYGVISFDCSGLVSGIYYYRFITGNISHAGKIIINR